MNRRAFAIETFFAFSFLIGCSCSKPPAAQRCQQCGMKIETKSTFTAELRSPGSASSEASVARFDSPRCALEKFVSGGRRDAVWVQSFYGVVWVNADTLVFIKGSDVTGPMGPDLVPVEKEHEAKFLKDHGGRVVTLAQVDAALLSGKGGG
jgi:nitrous oxide reductase accessory protein NosL